MNPFERLELPNQLDLDPTELSKQVKEASQRCHPDAGGDDESFHEIRRAGEILSDPALRIKAALEQGGTSFSERGGIPGEVMDFFSPVALVLERVSGFVDERGRAVSGLGKAVLDVRVAGLKGELEGLIGGLGGLQEELVSRFAEFDRLGWEQCCDEMADVWRGLVFLRKWLGQLREANGKIFEALLGG